MASTDRGMIAVDKMGAKVLFLDPETFETRKVLDGFQRTVHELLIVPETGLAYVPIFGDGIHGRNPNPGHTLCLFDLAKEAHVGDIDLRPYIAPHTLRLGPDGLIYVTCENSGVIAMIDRSTHTVVGTIESGSTNGHRLAISPDGRRLYTENEEDATVSVIDLPRRKLLGQIKTPQALAGIAVSGDNGTVVAVSDETPVLFLIDADKGEVRETLPLDGVYEARADRPLQPRLQRAGGDRHEQRHGELDRSHLPHASRHQDWQSADGYGLPRRRIIRRLPGRRLGARHRHSGAHMEAKLRLRNGVRVVGVLLERRQAKWEPVRRPETRQDKSSDTFTESVKR